MTSINKLILTLLIIIAANQAMANNAGLTTSTGNEVGLSISSYKYKEPGLMALKGTKFGIDYTRAYAFNNNWFIKGNLSLNDGDLDYSSYTTSGLSGVPDWHGEIRALIGRDFNTTNVILAPYTGFGFRYLNNDSSGMQTSTGHNGFLAVSRYNYLPIGLDLRLIVLENPVTINMEYDYLLNGRQTSYRDYATLNFKQTSGYGLRLGVMVARNNFSFGPYFNYWNIKESSHVKVIRGLFVLRSYDRYEPANKTIVYGFRFSYSF